MLRNGREELALHRHADQLQRDDEKHVYDALALARRDRRQDESGEHPDGVRRRQVDEPLLDGEVHHAGDGGALPAQLRVVGREDEQGLVKLAKGAARDEPEAHAATTNAPPAAMQKNGADTARSRTDQGRPRSFVRKR